MRPDNLLIRPLRAGDRADWRRLWTDYLAFYETVLPEPVFETTFARLLGEDPHDFHGRIALVDGQALGLVHFLFHRTCWKIENICYLQDLYVAPEARGTGLGRALIETVYAEADAAGAPQVWWLTQEHNAVARRLYDRIAVRTPFIRYNRPTA